jgi:hypothetical protein
VRIFAVLLLGCAGVLLGQVASGRLVGELRDVSSAVVPTATVTARHVSTGFIREVQTGPDGAYALEQLLPGPYTVTASKPGFRTLQVDAFVLEVNQTARLDLQLEIGSQNDSITVRGSVSPLQTGDASIGYHLSAHTITHLPLAQRNIISLVTLGPGAIPRHLGGFGHDVINDIQPVRGAVALNPPINGARSTMNAYLLDGAMNTDLNTFAIAVTPPMESVQEFRIQTSAPSAEFSQAAGGVIDVVSKSGGSEHHGSVFEYFRNQALDARNFFDDPALPRPIFRQNQFGGSLGGPLPLRETYFFASYEGLRAKSAKSSLSVVPDATIRAGDFRGRAPLFDPTNLDPATGARRPFPNNVIPAGRIDPIARTFLETYQPLPNRTGTTSNYLDATPNEHTDDNISGRLDRGFGTHGRMFGRYTFNNEDGRIAGVFPVLPMLEQLRAQQAALGYTLARQNWLNELRVSFTRLRIYNLAESGFGRNVAQDLGITGLPDDPFTYGIPNFLITNFSIVTDSPTTPQTQRDNLWHVSDGVSLVRGRHTLKTGFEWAHFQLNYLQSRFARGQFVFTGAFTAERGSPAGASGDPFADFLLGFPQFTNRNVGSAQAYLRRNILTGYFQDDWRISSRLTLNLGLRYEYFSPYEEKRGNLLNLDYSALPAPPTLVRVRSAVEPDRNNLAPRVGIAWRPSVNLLGRELVLRAGYGMYYNPPIAIETYDLVRNGQRNESNASDGVRPVLTLQNGFPQTSTTGFPSYFGLDSHARTPYVQHWNGGIQQELPSSVVLEIAYVGTKGTKLGRFRQFNTPLHVVTGANLSPRPGQLQALRPFPELGKIIQRQHISNSSYHSLQIKTEKKFSSRMSLLASFVWSKSIDDADSMVPGFFESIGAQDERNLRLERGLSFFHVGRRVSAGFVYSLPGFLKPVFTGWQFSGIVTLQDGTPLNPVYFAFDPANTGTPNRPDIVPGQSILLPRSERTADRFFKTAAFRAPEPFTFGNAGRNIIPGPGNNIFDLAIHRRFALAEQQGIELRAEFFNSFNHPNFGIPGPYPDFGPFFGKIFSTGEPRRIQLAVRYDF